MCSSRVFYTSCDHRDRFSFPRATFSPLGATPVDRRFFEIGVFRTPRARRNASLATPMLLRNSVLRVFSSQNARKAGKFVRIRSRSRVPSYRVRVDHVVVFGPTRVHLWENMGETEALLPKGYIFSSGRHPGRSSIFRDRGVPHPQGQQKTSTLVPPGS